MKRGIILMMLILSVSVSAWKADINEDGCVDQTDYDEVESRLGSTGTNDYDVNGDKSINQEDLDIIQQYMDQEPGCYECHAEECNIRDDDCDGLVDEDSGMCDENFICKSGECLFVAPECFDSDGNDIYTRGDVLGGTADGTPVDSKEVCVLKDISGTLREVQECTGNKCYVEEYTCDKYDDLVKEYILCDYGCRFGKCRLIEKRCNEADDGLDIFVNGEGTFDGEDISDTCLDSDNDGNLDTLKEYECFEEFDTATNTLDEWYKEYEIPCECEDGICVNVVRKQCTDTDGNDPYTKGFTTGELSSSGKLSDFDYCMIKDDGFEKTDRCSGDNCYLNEYVCNYRDTIEKFVHDCPLGCIEGRCIGTECQRGELFILNENAIMSYDEGCEITQVQGDELDTPSSLFKNMNDFECCSGTAEAFCVYDGECYISSRTNNFYEIEGEIVACGCLDSSCVLEDGDHTGLWYDLDSSMDLCEGEGTRCNRKWYSETGFRWIPPGTTREQEENVWEYESNDPECCGDDSGEFVACNGEACFCCSEEGMGIENSKCIKTAEPEPVQTQEPQEVQTTKVSDEPVVVPETEKDSNLLIIVPILFTVVVLIALFIFMRKTTP